MLISAVKDLRKKNTKLEPEKENNTYNQEYNTLLDKKLKEKLEVCITNLQEMKSDQKVKVQKKTTSKVLKVADTNVVNNNKAVLTTSTKLKLSSINTPTANTSNKNILNLKKFDTNKENRNLPSKENKDIKVNANEKQKRSFIKSSEIDITDEKIMMTTTSSKNILNKKSSINENFNSGNTGSKINTLHISCSPQTKELQNSCKNIIKIDSNLTKNGISPMIANKAHIKFGNLINLISFRTII